MAGWAPFETKYSIHQETYDYGKVNVQLGNRPYYELGIEKSREQSLQSGTAMAGDVEFSGQTTEKVIPSPYSPQGIPVSIYKPDNCPEKPAIFVYFFGGGLVLGGRAIAAPALKIISRDTGAIIVSVEYRLLPNKDSPCAPIDDGVIATRWVKENKIAVGGCSESKVGVGGDSSGGYIACCVTNQVYDLDFQVLFYPIGDLSRTQDSFEEFRHIPGLNEKILDWYFAHTYKDMPNYLTDPRINPMARENTKASPPALIILAELDPLFGAGLAYAQKLRDAGVFVQCEIIKGVPHSFFCYRKVFTTKSKEASDIVEPMENDPGVLSKIIFSDEAIFHLSVLQVNRHSVRIWRIQNPHATLEFERNSLKVNVFCAVTQKTVYGFPSLKDYPSLALQWL
ncbi:AB hydrolase superfamily protein c1039.03-like [Plakobranchus ocellatus]|uniref:AB hydrolase superfamily protein c1039.03-like n=1 Tax=Plakobranchus ocellatus TaxID=259542 RepID=A0AAV3ZT61_9GAST|nr:AB hydrolase superfamily protein c1039.03-like [Plakobranchus ocellatus]